MFCYDALPKMYSFHKHLMTCIDISYYCCLSNFLCFEVTCLIVYFHNHLLESTNDYIE